MARSDSPRKLGTVLEQLIDRLGLRAKMRETEAVEAWAELAGPQINRVTDSAWWKDGTLYVKISSSTWRQELHMSRREWREKLNERLDDPFVEEIVFR